MYRLVVQHNALEELRAAYEWLRKRVPDDVVMTSTLFCVSGYGSQW